MKKLERLFYKLIKLWTTVIIICSFLLSGCAYKLSNTVDALPGHVKVLFIPIFSNQSTEPGVEVYFTNALKKEVLTSKSVQLVNDETHSEAVLYGVIKAVEVYSDESVIEAKDTKYLPRGTVMSTQMKVVVTTVLTMKRKNSSEILWSSEFKQSLNYTPPQVTLPVINTTNNLYNLSARRQTLETLANQMMQLAFDRMVDNF